MLNPPYGLRFDIYERVQLPEHVPAIAELEEIELYPRIQVITDQEHAALRGHLLLSGVYVGENKEQEGLQHLIPVEITIPLSRVASVEEIAVEIENFDVDLLSTRSLNITGVLSLRGIEGIQTEETPAWNSDEFTVVHTNSASEQGNSEPKEYSGYNPYHRDPAREDDEASFEQERTSDASPVPPTFYAPYITPASVHDEGQEERDVWNLPYETLSVDDGTDQQEESNIEEQRIENQENGELRETKDIQDAKEENSATELSAAPEVWHFETPAEPALGLQEAETPIEEQAAEPTAIQRDDQEITWEDEGTLLTADVPQPEAEDEKPELKVAFGSKKENDAPAADSYGITSLLQKSKRTEEVLQLEEQIPVEKREEEQIEDVQWKNLFLGGSSEQTPFKRVKLCIVQREETLDTIADRYQLSTRELQLYNRLSEQSIEEGQVLYIP
ncbi:hypothetical protein J45TS6_39700 [Paenibacillus sp. J45TS6]|uniref:LysM peptidoglycan-binding domain-containing protein n=1 Tax=Paenibacillus sp. J45TS6 TaxID=2807196 RepID=UPI001B0881A5|nr:LysM peptidoglycan-binding domain-containing protein [Paenibacillus sp. J45TS6]GIP45511.1 hypothetical protein J45TS6_39700 [Paenibacillus sp. J45TS6]